MGTNIKARFRELEEVQERVPTNWAVKQRDALDGATAFIYSATSLSMVLEECRRAGLDSQSTSYAQHRWKNFIRHDSWLDLIYDEFPGCRPYENPRDRTRDLYVPVEGSEIIFDLKVTRWPLRLDHDSPLLNVAQWMYSNQSQEQRFHLDNRLFVVGSPESAVCRYDLAVETIERFKQSPKKNLYNLVLDHGRVTAGVLLVTQ